MTQRTQQRYQTNSWSTELDDFIRGISGGFLFGIPLLYTMEVWWVVSFSKPLRLLVAIAATLVIVFLLNRTEGFRKSSNVRLIDTVMDSIETLAIGIFCTSCVLILLQEITLSTPLGEALGKLIFESVPFALGVALARSLLKGDRETSSDEQKRTTPTRRQPKVDEATINATLKDIGATLIGAIFVGFNISPTDEIPMLAAAVSPLWLLALIAASLLISYSIVFQAGFVNQAKRRQQQGIFQRPMSETVASYLVSLIAAVLMLCFFHQLTFDDPWSTWLSYTIILGLPTTVGGAAGRLTA